MTLGLNSEIRIERIKKRLANASVDFTEGNSSQWSDRIDLVRCLRHIEKLQTALAFYADEKNWLQKLVYEDDGDIARKALEE